MKDKYLVRHGGLLRCCLASLDEEMVAAESPPKEGDVCHCKYHDDGGMIFRNGGWEWNQPVSGGE